MKKKFAIVGAVVGGSVAAWALGADPAMLAALSKKVPIYEVYRRR